MKVMNPTNLVRSSITIVWILNCHYASARDVQKRQIYREQVLPHVGGKIPDTAFETDRLALNRLQKEGIAVPDGVLLEQRNPQVFQYPHKSLKPVYRVKQTSDQRYIPIEGKYQNSVNTVETTYSLPQIAHHNVVVPRDPMEPTHTRLVLPNPLRKGHPKIQQIDAEKNHQNNIDKYGGGHSPNQIVHPVHIHPSYVPKPMNVYPTYVHPNPNMWVIPGAVSYQQRVPFDWNHYIQYDHRTNQIFNDFDAFFNQYPRTAYPTNHHPAAYFYHH